MSVQKMIIRIRYNWIYGMVLEKNSGEDTVDSEKRDSGG